MERTTNKFYPRITVKLTPDGEFLAYIQKDKNHPKDLLKVGGTAWRRGRHKRFHEYILQRCLILAYLAMDNYVIFRDNSCTEYSPKKKKRKR